MYLQFFFKMSNCIDRTRLKFLNSFVVLCVVLLNILVVDGFNIDAFNYAAYGTQQESMFGFTVAVHKQGQNRGWVLVGAPEAQSQYQGDRVRLGGVVYKCRSDGDDPCQEIPFDRDGNQYFLEREMDQKSKQWFGATLSTSGNPSGGPVVACAPRYVWYSKEMNRRDPVGTCFVSDSSFEKFEEYSPCRTSNWGYHRQGSCQAGFSAAINSIGDRLFVGAPGSYYWQGQMYSIDAHARFNYTPGLLGTTYGAKGSVHQQSLETRPAIFQTREGKQQDDDSYLGYSTIVGDFLDTGEQGIAVGMPRGAELRGKVLLFTWNLTNYKNISSSQLGSYFGYSLAAADIDGDKKLDLIVGAPMHTEANNQEKYDVGRVYVFYQGGGYGSFNKSSFIDGINSKSRFGHSVAYLGDLNLDGYDDFAVGAPYDGENNRGAVYIYYGSAKGVLEKYGQVIYAEDIVSKNGIPVNTFGFSITGGLDMDGNDYPDMAVGAYLSNSAFFFRARPVVRVESYVRFRTESKQIDIKKKNCQLPNGQQGTCTTIDFCIKYSGKGIPQQIQLNVQYILDSKTNIPRMAFLRKNTHTLNETITLYKDGQENCQTEKIYIKNDIRDKLTSLEAEVKYFMIEEGEDASYYSRSRNPQSQLKPVVDLNLPPSRKDSISILNNCGSDNICVPNLHVNVTKNVEKYLLDSNTNLEFDIIVSNFREDSFETIMDLSYPEGIYFNKIEVKDDMKGILCSAGENRTIRCDIGNPLPANRIAKIRMIFVPYHKQGMSPSYEFDVHVNSSNPEDPTTLQDNYQHITVDIWVNSALDVSGRSIPLEIYLPNITQYTSETIDREYDIGPQVTHLYTLRNKGPATIYEAEMYFLWPWQTLAGEDLLYLLEQPHVPEGVKCEIPAPANYKNYQLDLNLKSMSIWERLQVDSSSHDINHKNPSVKTDSVKNTTAIAGDIWRKGDTTKIDEEIHKSSGDASIIYENRVNASAKSSSESAQNRWAPGSRQDSSGHISKAGETVYTKLEWRETTVNGQRVSKLTNVTTVKDATGKIIDTFYSSDDSTGDQISASSNMDSFGQNIGRYKQKTKANVIYSSSGNVGSTTGEENLSVSGGFGGEEEQYQQKTASEATQQNIYRDQHSSGGPSGVNENKHLEEHAYIVGGGSREGGGQVTPTAVYEEDQIVRHQESFDSKTIQQGSVSGTGSSRVDTAGSRVNTAGSRDDKAYEARRRYEENRQYEERIRQQEEQRRKLERQQHTGQNVVVTSDQERVKYEERLRKDEENRQHYQEQLRRLEATRAAEEKARQEAHDLQVRREEERRRQQSAIDNERRRQPTEEERRRLQQQRDEEIRRRQEEDRRRQEEERRRQYEIEESHRLEEEKRRQWSEQQRGASSTWQDIGSRDRTNHAGRTRTGYFDAQGIYHNERDASAGRVVPGGVAFNRTWTIEGTASLDDAEGSRGGQLDFGKAAASGNQFRTQTIDLGMAGVGNDGASSSRGQEQEFSGGKKWVNSGQRTQGGTFSGTLEGGVAEQDRYSSEWQRNRWEDEQAPHLVERDNVPTDQPDLSRHRGKRQVPEIDPDIANLLQCTATKCFYVKCVVGTLKKDEFISIILRSRLNVRAVRHLSTTQPLKLSSMMVARISKLPYIGKPKEQALHSHEIFTIIPAGETELAPQVVPLWIILLSAIAGTLILLLVILLLYKLNEFLYLDCMGIPRDGTANHIQPTKCGFFKRKRPSSAPERQPLRTNGYHAD